MQKYGGNPEMKEFIQRFAGLLGNHFSKLGEQQDQPNQDIRTKNSWDEELHMRHFVDAPHISADWFDFPE